MNTKLMNESLLNYIESHISPVTECGCWLWEEDGRQSANYDKLTAKVDEFMYRVYRGPVPENQEVVHTCRLDCCVNPQHLSLRSKTHPIEKDKVHNGH